MRRVRQHTEVSDPVGPEPKATGRCQHPIVQSDHEGRSRDLGESTLVELRSGNLVHQPRRAVRSTIASRAIPAESRSPAPERPPCRSCGGPRSARSWPVLPGRAPTRPEKFTNNRIWMRKTGDPSPLRPPASVFVSRRWVLRGVASLQPGVLDADPVSPGRMASIDAVGRRVNVGGRLPEAIWTVLLGIARRGLTGAHADSSPSLYAARFRPRAAHR